MTYTYDRVKTAGSVSIEVRDGLDQRDVVRALVQLLREAGYDAARAHITRREPPTRPIEIPVELQAMSADRSKIYEAAGTVRIHLTPTVGAIDLRATVVLGNVVEEEL